MKTFFSSFLFLFTGLMILATPWTIWAQSLSVNEAFDQAQAAYDNGNFDKAQETYEALLAQGVLSPNLYFNLGNSLVRQGKLSRAILAYRRAWMLAPRDPDIQANLKFALNNAQALSPTVANTERVLHVFSRSQWLRIAVVVYWGLAICLIAHLALPAIRPVTGRVAIGLTILLFIAGSGIFAWQALQTRPELVIIPPQQKALFGPLDTATPSFALPAGSIVRLEETSGDWNKIRHGKQTGWIKSSACKAVYPFQAAHDVL